MKFYSHYDSQDYGTMYALCSRTYNWTPVRSPADADIIVWNGGEDIGTSIYGEKPVDRWGSGLPSERDKNEMALFEKFKDDKSKFLLGICRGAQLLNCLNGGSLYQDVNNHGRSHDMVDLRTSEIVRVTSTHHQQMRPNPKSGTVIGIASCSTFKNGEVNGRQTFVPDHTNIENGVDVEIMWYSDTRSLCIQGHPEYVPNSRFADYSLELIQELYQESVLRAAA